MGTTEPTETISFTNTLLRPLTISKTVEGTSTDQEFAFTVTVAGANGDYTAVRNTTEGDTTTETVTFFEGTATIRLKDKESITINGLPYGTTWTVTETAADGYVTYYQVGSSEDRATGNTASGTLTGEANGVNVAFTNWTTYQLPETGGPGTHWYTLGGLCLMAGALWLYKNPRGKRGRDGLN